MACKSCQKARQALNKVVNIAQGYTNLAVSGLVPNSDTEILACNRMKICEACPFKVKLVKIAGKQYYSCSKCSCPIDAKTRSTGESCPINKW